MKYLILTRVKKIFGNEMIYWEIRTLRENTWITLTNGYQQFDNHSDAMSAGKKHLLNDTQIANEEEISYLQI